MRGFFFLLIALWLPVQATAAIASPFCRHAHEPLTETVTCHGQVVEVAVQASDLDCDNCGMCHLASAGYLPTASIATVAPAESVRIALLPVEPPSFIADPPDHPPRSLR